MWRRCTAGNICRMIDHTSECAQIRCVLRGCAVRSHRSAAIRRSQSICALAAVPSALRVRSARSPRELLRSHVRRRADAVPSHSALLRLAPSRRTEREAIAATSTRTRRRIVSLSPSLMCRGRRAFESTARRRRTRTRSLSSSAAAGFDRWTFAVAFELSAPPTSNRQRQAVPPRRLIEDGRES